MKKTIIVTILSLILAVVAIAIYGNMHQGSETWGGAHASSTSVKSGKMPVFDQVNLSDLDKTGICADYETTKTEGDCKNTRWEESIAIDDETTVVFQSICETGLDEVETGLSKTKSYPYSVRKTLNVFLENKSSNDRELIKSIYCNYAFDKYPRLLKPEYYDFPYVLDAEAANDGSLLRFLVTNDRGDVVLYQFDLQNRNWIDGFEEVQYAHNVFRRTISPSSGKLTQAYFVLPDVINVKSGQGCEYSSEIAFEDMPIYLPGGNKLFDPKPAKLIKDAIALRCVYWNSKGNYDFIKYQFMKHGKFDKMRGSFTSDDTVPDTIKDEPPVPTQQSWEGWHKLVRNAAAQQ